MARLFSKHHDRYHLHKTLGFAVLAHFAYRAAVYIAKGDAFRASSRTLLWLSIALHLALHVTSFLFSLPQRRNQHAPMIWPAYRAHNAVFASRNLVGALGILELGAEASSWSRRALCRTLFIWTFMALADLASWYCSQGDATTRGMPYPRSMRQLSIIRLKSFYMQCQFHATLLSVTDANLSFFCVLPIQLASFAMTLARKHKITSLQWHLVYALALWANYAFMFVNPVGSRLALAGALGGIAKEVRQHLRLNKYLLWGLVVLAHDAGAALLPETISGRTMSFIRLAMFLAATRHLLRLGRIFLSEGILDEPPPCDQGDEDLDARAAVYRVNADDHRASVLNGHNPAVATEDRRKRD